MRISDWSSDVCSSDLIEVRNVVDRRQPERIEPCRLMTAHAVVVDQTQHTGLLLRRLGIEAGFGGDHAMWFRSEERREGKSVSVRVDLGGRRIIKKRNMPTHSPHYH